MLNYPQLVQLVANSYNLTPDVQVADNVRCSYTNRDDEFVISIPGTTDIAGWIRDFSAWPKWINGLGIIHEGFGSGGQKLWNRVRYDLPHPKMISVVGHSLGGALAQVLCVYMAKNTNLVFRCVTVGSPRVAFKTNWSFHHNINKYKNVKLFGNVGDPITRVPTLPPYSFSTKLIEIGSDPDPISMNNHNINLYISNLSRYN
jgi:hypothetical protein